MPHSSSSSACIKKSPEMQTIFSLLLLVAAACAVDYCKDVCKDHTMCKYKGPNCPGRRYAGVTKSTDKQKALDAHNKYRSDVAMGKTSLPSAANMTKLKWDDELAKIAQMWADQCKFGHDSCRNVVRFYVGQNVYEGSSYGSAETDAQDWDGAVKDWYNEISLVQPSVLGAYVGGDWGHFTQLVWDKTKYVGCGFTAYKGDDGWFNKYYVCNYGPGGNMRGQRVYEKGTACSKCENKCENGLCLW